MPKRKTKEGETLVLSRDGERIEVLVFRARYGQAELHIRHPEGWSARHAHLEAYRPGDSSLTTPQQNG